MPADAEESNLAFGPPDSRSDGRATSPRLRWPLAGTYRRLGYFIDPAAANEEPLNLARHKVGPRIEWV